MKLIGKWFFRIFVAIDQLGNAIAGGLPDITISSRVGHFANKVEPNALTNYWKLLERIINMAFYPLDGPDHCLKSLAKDNEKGHQVGNDVMRGILGLIVLLSCALICVLTWMLYVFGMRPEIEQLKEVKN